MWPDRKLQNSSKISQNVFATQRPQVHCVTLNNVINWKCIQLLCKLGNWNRDWKERGVNRGPRSPRSLMLLWMDLHWVCCINQWIYLIYNLPIFIYFAHLSVAPTHNTQVQVLHISSTCVGCSLGWWCQVCAIMTQIIQNSFLLSPFWLQADFRTLCIWTIKKNSLQDVFRDINDNYKHFNLHIKTRITDYAPLLL